MPHANRSRRRPRVRTGPADAHARIGERIVELSHTCTLPDGTRVLRVGLMSIMERPDGTLLIELYRLDGGIGVRAPKGALEPP